MGGLISNAEGTLATTSSLVSTTVASLFQGLCLIQGLDVSSMILQQEQRNDERIKFKNQGFFRIPFKGKKNVRKKKKTGGN